MSRLICGGCSRPWVSSRGECPACRTTYPIRLSQSSQIITTPKRGIRVSSLQNARRLIPVRFEGAISDALDGVVLGLTILLWGLPGAGKSTLAAQLGAAMAAKLQGSLYWCDREQLNSALLHACFARTQSPIDRVKWITPDLDDDKVTWADALDAVGPDAAAVVIDSLQTWATRQSEQKRLLEFCRRMRKTVIVISHATKAGDAAGKLVNQHAADACVLVAPDALTVTKSRWCSAPRTLQRALYASLKT